MTLGHDLAVLQLLLLATAQFTAYKPPHPLQNTIFLATHRHDGALISHFERQDDLPGLRQARHLDARSAAVRLEGDRLSRKGHGRGTLQGEFPGCECPKPDGKCPCGDACQCAATAMSKALVDAGYVVTPCGGGKGPCPAVALGTCTCGPDCACGDDCQCALCPGVAVKGKTIELKVERALGPRGPRGPRRLRLQGAARPRRRSPARPGSSSASWACSGRWSQRPPTERCLLVVEDPRRRQLRRESVLLAR